MESSKGREESLPDLSKTREIRTPAWTPAEEMMEEGEEIRIDDPRKEELGWEGAK